MHAWFAGSMNSDNAIEYQATDRERITTRNAALGREASLHRQATESIRGREGGQPGRLSARIIAGDQYDRVECSASMRVNQVGSLKIDERRGPGRSFYRSKTVAVAHHKVHKSAVSSAQPIIRLRFWTATPAAPLIRLSRQASTTIRPRTTRRVMSQKLVCAESLVVGKWPTTRTNGLSA